MKTLEKFLEFKNEILVENSRLYKQAVLKKYATDEDVKFYLNYVYNPYITTGISTKKVAKKFDVSSFGLFDLIESFSSIQECLKYVQKHNTGSDKVLKSICAFKAQSCHTAEIWALFDAIITKTLSLGVDAKTINSVIPNLIPTFNVQLANKYFDNPKVVEGKEFALTTKIDGGRIIAIKKDGQVKFFTRAGQVYEGLVDLEAEIQLRVPDNTVLDGELTLLDKGNLDSKAQYKETMKISRKDGIKHGLKMLVFDMLTATEFETQTCTRPYSVRRNCLDKINLLGAKYFEVLPILYIGRDSSIITKYLNELTAAGEEGVMINIYDAPYEFKRSNVLLKVKRMNDMDLRVIGFEEGEGRLAGMLGAIYVKYKNNNTVKVGSGFSDEIRREIWLNKERYLNSIVSVQYFEETSNADGGESLRFPIFLDFRPDLTEAAY